MFSNRGSFIKFFFLVLFLGLSAGFAFNYYYGKAATGIVSPVVFGKSTTNQAKGSSPFSSFFGKLNPQTNNSLPISPAATLSYSGNRNSAGGQPGDVLGEKTSSITTSGSDNSNQGNSNNSTNSNFSGSTPNTSTDSPGSASNSVNSQDSSDSSALTPVQQAVEDGTSLVITDLKSGSYAALYNLMSADFKNTFSLEDFVSSFAGAARVAGGTVISTPRIYGANSEWAEQSIRLNLSDGSVQNYLNIYHLEGSGANSAWTLFATQDQ